MNIEIGRGDLHNLILLLGKEISEDEASLEGSISESDRTFLERYVQEHKELLGYLSNALNDHGKRAAESLTHHHE